MDQPCGTQLTKWCAGRGPEQIIRRDTEPWGAGRGSAGDRAIGRGPHRGGRGSHGSGVTLEGQEQLAALMSEGLGDHVFFWRLYQVRAGSMLALWLIDVEQSSRASLSRLGQEVYIAAA